MPFCVVVGLTRASEVEGVIGTVEDLLRQEVEGRAELLYQARSGVSTR